MNMTKTLMGNDITKRIDQITEYNKVFFDLFIEIGQSTRIILTSKLVSNENEMENTSFSLIVKIRNTFEAVVRLCKVGLVAEARALIRVMLEAIIIFRCIENDPEFLIQYKGATKRENVKRLKNIQEHSEYFEGIIDNIERYKQMELDILKEIADEDIKAKKIKEWAKTARMEYAYLFVYSQLSDDVHTDSNALKRYENEELLQLESRHVDLYEVKHILFISCDIFLKALESYCNVLVIDKGTFNNLLKKRLVIGGLLI